MSAAPVRILRIMTRLNIGGPSIHVFVLGRLAPERFSTCLVTGEPEATEGDLSGLRASDRMRILRVKTLGRPIRPWADLASLIRLVSMVWRERPQIIHTHMAKAGALGRLAGMLYNGIGPGRRAVHRAVLVHTFHGHVLDGYFHPMLSRMFLAVERWLARRTDCLIAVSETVRDELLAKGIGRAAQWRVIRVGLDLSAFSQLAPPAGQPTMSVGMVGRLVPIKNPRLFLHALREVALRPLSTSVRGVIVGDGPLRRALEEEAKAMGLGVGLRFDGWRRDLPAVYEELEAVCLTSWNEGTPVALVEAMAAGRVVVATDVGGVREVFGEDRPSAPIAAGTCHVATRGILVPPGDVHSVAAALTMVAQDATLRQRLGSAARVYVMERFTAERLVREMTALYEALLERRGTA